MTYTAPVFEETYRDYLARLVGIDLPAATEKLGVEIKGGAAIIPLMGKLYRVSTAGVTGPEGRKPRLEICVVLCRYLLMCPKDLPRADAWAAYRDFKDTGPLTVFFANDVEQLIANRFSGRLKRLRSVCEKFGGRPPRLELSYELAMEFTLLPRIPALLLFNDAEDEFPAACSVLFKNGADEYLDAESLAILASLFAVRLCRKNI